MDVSGIKEFDNRNVCDWNPTMFCNEVSHFFANVADREVDWPSVLATTQGGEASFVGV